MQRLQAEKRDFMKRMKYQEKASYALSKSIMIDAETVMDEANTMMKIAEEMQQKNQKGLQRRIEMSSISCRCKRS